MFSKKFLNEIIDIKPESLDYKKTTKPFFSFLDVMFFSKVRNTWVKYVRLPSFKQ